MVCDGLLKAVVTYDMGTMAALVYDPGDVDPLSLVDCVVLLTVAKVLVLPVKPP